MKKVLLYSVALLMVFAAGCNKWLDVKDPSKILEPEVYSSETNIDNVLNGFYRLLVSDDLYGNNLSAGILDALAQNYVVASTSDGANSVGMRNFYLLSTADYQNNDVRGTFDKVWNSGYSLILKLNAFIANMDAIEGQGILPEDRRLLYLGEAYGIRAMMHLDLYRLYGPVKAAGETTVMPYHVNPVIEIPDYLTPEKFLETVMADLNKADGLLKANDPIVKDKKVWDGAADDDNLDTEARFAKMFRNKRMNYWAVQVLKMRVLLLEGKNEEVVTLGGTILSEAVDANYVNRPAAADANERGGKNGAPFGWTPHDNNWVNNAVMYDEVIFGASQLNMATWWNGHFAQSGQDNDTRVYLEACLRKNIFGLDQLNDIRNGIYDDVRLQPMSTSLIQAGKVGVTTEQEDRYYVSTKYQNASVGYDDREGHTPYVVRNFRGLLRLSEVEYMVAEANLNLSSPNLAGAITAVNNVLKVRNYRTNEATQYSANKQLRSDATKADILDMLKHEYYREFINEGQAFFFLKRNNITPYSGSAAGNVPDWTESRFMWVRPQAEQDFD